MVDQAFAPMESIRLGVIMERRPSDHPWVDHVWRCVDIVAAPASEEAAAPHAHRLMRQQGDVLRIMTAPVELGLHRKETQGYKLNLSQTPPRVFIALRDAEPEDGALERVPFKATVCPFEAEAYTEAGAENVDGVVMPEFIRAWVTDFVDRHHEDIPFIKRKRGPKKNPRDPFGHRPPVEREGNRHD